MVEEILAAGDLTLTDIDALAFGRGPGSFTGVRIGIGIAQGLALGANLPMIGVSTLATMAQGAWRKSGATRVLAAIDDFSLENTERIVHGWIEQKGYGMGQVMNTLRLALVGAGKGPGMYDVTSFIGKEETLRRIDHILATLKPAE